MDASRNFILAAKALNAELQTDIGAPLEGLRSISSPVVLRSLVRGTRGYIESIANQANGAYENGWFDACAVMVRRLLETLIIEAFEHGGIAHKIKNSTGDFLYLRDLITAALNEPSWNLSRNCKQALPRVKDVGDKSAHSRRYNAHRGDIDAMLSDVRLVVQEFLYLAALK